MTTAQVQRVINELSEEINRDYELRAMKFNKTELSILHRLSYSTNVILTGKREKKQAYKLVDKGLITVTEGGTMNVASRAVTLVELIKAQPQENINPDLLRRMVRYDYSFLNFRYDEKELERKLDELNEVLAVLGY